MTTVTSIIRKDADKATDPLRMALAQAIGEARKAEAAVEAQHAAIERARTLVEAAAVKCEAAEAAVAAARAHHAEQVASALKASSEVRAPAAMRVARSALADAEDELQAGRTAEERLQSDLADLEDAARWHRNNVAAAVNAVLAPIVRQLLAESLELKTRVAVNMAIVGSILSADDEVRGFDGAAAARAKTRRDEPFLGLREQLDRLGASVTEQAHERITAALIATQHALAALRTNSAAPVHFAETKQ